MRAERVWQPVWGGNPIYKNRACLPRRVNGRLHQLENTVNHISFSGIAKALATSCFGGR